MFKSLMLLFKVISLGKINSFDRILKALGLAWSTERAIALSWGDHRRAAGQRCAKFTCVDKNRKVRPVKNLVSIKMHVPLVVVGWWSFLRRRVF